MFLNIIFFGCGIGFAILLDRHKENKNKQFNCGDDDVCKNCCYKKTVLETLEGLSDESNNA